MKDQLALVLPLVVDRKTTATTFVRMKGGSFRPDFLEWLEKNWDIYRAFEREADRVRGRGRSHYSARTIGEFLRHHTLTREEGGDFKVNDHYWPDLARLYTMMNPGTEGFFEFRVLKGAVRAA